MPLIQYVIDDTLSQAMPDLRQMLLQFIDDMNLSVANVSVHASIPKEDLVRLKSTQTIKFIWLNGDIVLDMPKFCYF